MNPETTPLAQGCMACLGLEATTQEQHDLQEQCAGIIEQLMALEELLNADPLTYPEMES